MLKNILVPLDGSAMSEAVLPPVKALAKALGSDVILAHVMETPVDHPERAVQEKLDEVAAGVRPVVDEYLDKQAALFQNDGVSVTTATLYGRAADAIIDYATSEDVQLIAMATHGRSGVVRAVLGSVMTRVLHHSSCPVLSIKPQKVGRSWASLTSAPSLVMVPLDGSEMAERALPYGEELARRLGVPINLVHVLPENLKIKIGNRTTSMWDREWEVAGQLDVVTEGYVAGIGRRLGKEGLLAGWEVPKGDPGQTITEYAHSDPGTIVVIATHGRSGVRRAAIGSVAEKVVRGTHAPVLVVGSASSAATEDGA